MRPRATTSAAPATARSLALFRAGLLLLRPPLLTSRLRTGRLAGRPSFGALASDLLLELLHLLLHELAGEALLLQAELVVPAVGTAAPSFGVCFSAGGAEDALGQRHRSFVVYPEPRRRRGISGELPLLICATVDASLRSA